MIYGYARVSTGAQDLGAQTEQLRAAGCAEIVTETASGKDGKRRRLAKLLGQLEPGDVVLVTRLDRLARSQLDLHNMLDKIATAGASFRSLADPWCDTTTPAGRLLLAVLGGLAEFERALILSRTAEGRARAVARGQKMGRKPALTPAQAKWVAEQKALDPPTPGAELARFLDVSQATISRVPPAAATPADKD